MPGKPIDDPLPATTYAGFAVSTPGPAAKDSGPAAGIERAHGLSSLRRDGTRRGLSPMVAGGALAATVMVGGVLGLVLANGPPAGPAASTPAPRLAAPPPGADVGPAPPHAPLALTVTEPVASAAPPPAAAKVRRKTAPRPPAVEAPRPRASPSCGRLDCQEAGLDVLDQELNTAYAEAIRSGAAAGPLSAQQERWVVRQERLRHDDPAMAADLYRARIAELRELAAHSDQSAASQ